MQEERSLMDRKISFSWLLSFYGSLLTENQQQISRLYAEEDFSLSEIAEQFGVSRQSVYDTVSRTEKQLQDFEKKLGLRARIDHMESTLTECAQLLSSVHATPETARYLKDALLRIHHLLEEEER